ncbi:IclR family transcriptional regulator [Paenibacillus validus]|uniref:Helix-turn-helix domain-containing protein n=3 Tax=Paenibacillus validus TaxID=44253 RepID=A0A7X3CVW6_9BACL|nr:MULTISPECIES: IclR family transcriptional regulator [Paenibacillus]MED4601533.1 IclR family transcriptional regulator [Paenibacillus validus]MUG73602.1 helix-turn-helix domain-containing protein [Paenibacillus validus]
MRELNVEPVRAVERAIQILNCFSFERPDQSIEEIIRKTKLAKATVYRLLWTLERNGLIHYDPKENTYRLGYKSLEYGGIVLEHLDIHREAAHYLQDLQELTGHSAVLAVPQGETLQYLMRFDSDEGFQPRNFIGRRRILHNGALGIVLLAYMEPEFVRDLLRRYPLEAFTPDTMTDHARFIQRLEDIRKEGFFVDAGETFSGFTAIAVPVFDSKEKAIAAIGVSGSSFKMEGEARERLIHLTKETALKISLRMGYIIK